MSSSTQRRFLNTTIRHWLKKKKKYNAVYLNPKQANDRTKRLTRSRLILALSNLFQIFCLFDERKKISCNAKHYSEKEKSKYFME